MQQDGILDLLEVTIRKMIHTDEFVFVLVSLIILAIVFLYINRKSKKNKLYLSIFIAIVSGMFLLESVNKLFLLSLALIIPFYLFIQKIEINKTIKSILRIIIGVAVFVSFLETFFCSGGDGSFNLCGIITLLLIVRPLILIDSIIVLYYGLKAIKKHFSLIIQTYRTNQVKILFCLFVTLIILVYVLYQNTQPKKFYESGILKYDTYYGFSIDRWNEEQILENPKDGITYELLRSYENKNVIIDGKKIVYDKLENKDNYNNACTRSPDYCTGMTNVIIPEKIQAFVEQNTEVNVANESNQEKGANFVSEAGEQLITITSPKINDRINATQPLIILGKARKVFSEGEFDISASYLLDNQKKVVARTFATCSITGNGCDWTSGNFIDFKSTLDLSAAPVCYVSVEFYKRDDKTPQAQPFFVLPLWLYGNGGCQ